MSKRKRRSVQRSRHRGVVIDVEFPATLSHFRHRHAHVYLPPAWFRQSRPHLPVVLMLSGTPGDTNDWTRAGDADRTADRYAKAHDGYAPILVFADENGSTFADSECVDGPNGNAETYLIADVRREVIHRFHAAVDAKHWAIIGSSEGGTCAITLALRHPDLFATFADFGGDVSPNFGSKRTSLKALFGGNETTRRSYDPVWLLQHRSLMFANSTGLFDVGSDDQGPLRAARRIVAVATTAGLDVNLTVRPGRHNFRYWRGSFQRTLPWLGLRFGLDAYGRNPRTLG